MSRQVRRLRRNQDAVKALAQLSQAIPQLQGSIRGIAQALPTGVAHDENIQKMFDSLVEDCQTLARENAVLRETFLRLLIVLSEDSEENIRKVEEMLRVTVQEELKGT
jgi:hypothetical protein